MPAIPNIHTAASHHGALLLHVGVCARFPTPQTVYSSEATTTTAHGCAARTPRSAVCGVQCRPAPVRHGPPSAEQPRLPHPMEFLPIPAVHLLRHARHPHPQAAHPSVAPAAATSATTADRPCVLGHIPTRSHLWRRIPLRPRAAPLPHGHRSSTLRAPTCTEPAGLVDSPTCCPAAPIAVAYTQPPVARRPISAP